MIAASTTYRPAPTFQASSQRVTEMTRHLGRQQDAERDGDRGGDKQARPSANEVKKWVSPTAHLEVAPEQSCTVALHKTPLVRKRAPTGFRATWPLRPVTECLSLLYPSLVRGATGVPMHKVIIALAIAIPVLASPSMASAKGCLKGAAVGGVAGHVAGHHGLVGAAAGCAIEHHREKVKDKAARQPSVSAPENNPSGMRTNATPAPK